MDRTIIDIYRAEEKELSSKIHKRLETLMLVYQPNSEFRKIFAEGMFLKPNQKGFFQVMNFLFSILDSNEYRKRFYWPVVDKKSEGIFRTCVVEYLNYLNKKHNLQWKQQWNYLVQMPGGSKFLTFLIDLADFVTGEIVKQRQKNLDERNCKLDEYFSKSLLTKLKLKNKCFKVNALRYVESLDAQTKKYKENSDNLRNNFKEISIMCDIPLNILLSESFADEFCNLSNEMLINNFRSKNKRMLETEENVKAIKILLENYHSQKKNLEYDADVLKATADEFCPNEEIISNNQINFEVVAKVFTKICPIVDDVLSTYDENTMEVLKFENEALSKLHSDILKIDNDAKKIISTVNRDLENIKNDSDVSPSKKDDLLMNSNLLQKLVCTPPILNLNFNQSQFKLRLPLMQNVSSPSNDEFTFANNQTTIMVPPSSSRKKKDLSKILNKTMNSNSTKIVDPTTFLKSLKKNSKNNSNFIINEIGSPTPLVNQCDDQPIKNVDYQRKLPAKRLEEVFNKENETEDEIKLKSHKSIEKCDVSESPKSGFNLEKSEISKRKLFLEVPKKIDKLVKGSPTFLQKSPLFLEKITTSPSGRLAPLIKFNKTEISKIVQIGTELSEINNDFGVLNISETKDFLFNESDSILKDIPM